MEKNKIFAINTIELKKDIEKKNIDSFFIFTVVLVLVNVCNYTIFGNKELPSLILKLQFIFLNIIPIIFTISTQKLFNIREKESCYIKLIYLSFYIIFLSGFFINFLIETSNYYYLFNLVSLITLIAFGPMLSIYETIISIVLSFIFPLFVILYYRLSIENMYNLTIITIFVAILLQVLYFNYYKQRSRIKILENLNKELLIKSEVDELTGLLNRHGIQRKLNELVNLKFFIKNL